MKEPISKSDLGRVEILISDAKFWACTCAAMSMLGLIFTFWTISAQAKFGEGSWNAITFSLGLLQTLLAMIAIGGFWLVKGAAINAASESAEKTTKKFLKDYMKEEKFSESLTKAVIQELDKREKDEQGATAEPGDEGPDKDLNGGEGFLNVAKKPAKKPAKKGG